MSRSTSVGLFLATPFLQKQIKDICERYAVAECLQEIESNIALPISKGDIGFLNLLLEFYFIIGEQRKFYSTLDLICKPEGNIRPDANTLRWHAKMIAQDPSELVSVKVR